MKSLDEYVDRNQHRRWTQRALAIAAIAGTASMASMSLAGCSSFGPTPKATVTKVFEQWNAAATAGDPRAADFLCNTSAASATSTGAGTSASASEADPITVDTPGFVPDATPHVEVDGDRGTVDFTGSSSNVDFQAWLVRGKVEHKFAGSPFSAFAAYEWAEHKFDASFSSTRVTDQKFTVGVRLGINEGTLQANDRKGTTLDIIDLSKILRIPSGPSTQL